MLMTHGEFDVALRETALKELNFLEAEYGFSIFENPSGVFYAESPHTFISVYIDYDRLMTTLQPRLEIYASDGAVDIYIILSCLEQLEVEVLRPRDQNELKLAVRRDANLLRTHLKPFLQDDYSQWPKVQVCVRQRSILRYQKWLGLSFDDAERIRDSVDRAHKAVAAARFDEAITILESIKSFYPYAEAEIEAARIFKSSQGGKSATDKVR